MSDVQELYKEASLSFAAYANLFPGASGLPLIDALKEAKMSASQAADFAAKWVVIDQYIDSSGAAATVFEEIGTHKRYLAIRGTEGLGDYNADYILALGFPSYLSPQFIRLQGVVQDWLDNGTLTSGFSVTGHSLGGYLAVAVGTWFRSQAGETYTYNAPGIGGGVGNAIDAFRDVFGLSDSALVTGITNLRGTQASHSLLELVHSLRHLYSSRPKAISTRSPTIASSASLTRSLCSQCSH
jgi:hypothetical protein